MARQLDYLQPAEAEDIGKFCATLLSSPDSWMCRRKEAVTVLDESTIRRHQSVDFTTDSFRPFADFRETCEGIFGTNVYVAPLFILEKKPAWALAFDLEDESGRSLPLMTSNENGSLSAATLKVLCRRKLTSAGFARLPDDLATKLELLAESDADEGKAWLRRLRKPLPGDPDQKEIATLLDRKTDGGMLAWWLTTLSYASIVPVAFEATDNHRRIIKLSYEEPLNVDSKLQTKLAWRSFCTWIISPFIGSGRYHFEVKAPPDLRLTQATLVDETRRRPIRADGFRRRAHLSIEDAHQSRGAIAAFGLRVSGRGILGGAFAAAVTVLLAEIACIHWSEEIAAGSSSAPALLLVLPGLIATYVARSDQHGLTTRLLAIPRWILLLLSGFSAYYAAGRLALLGPAVGEEAVASQAEAIESTLLPPMIAAAAGVVLIGIGWACTRQMTHRARWWASWVVRTLLRTRFRMHFGLPLHVETAWGHVAEGDEPGVLPQRRVSRATLTSDQDYRYVAGRYKGWIKWTHGVDVSPGPEGATLSWIFQVEAPLLLRPLAGLLVFRERRLAESRVRALRALYA